jgi:hypothetical protein
LLRRCQHGYARGMHADDTNYTVIKNGTVVVSGTGPAIRVADNRLIIRDGPKNAIASRYDACGRLAKVEAHHHVRAGGRICDVRCFALAAPRRLRDRSRAITSAG